MTAASSYDDVPYLSQPRSYTHPDCLATQATLLGMTPPPVTKCRVLELGCGTGGNLLPMAATLPECSFVGVDLSARQIDMAQEIAARLGLDNVAWSACSILDLDEGLGAFDYIICHGVYSWVPSPVQDRILRICGRHLSPQGIAYISYNTYPGWHARGMVRDMLAYHVQDVEDAGARVSQARAFLDFLTRGVHDRDGFLAKILDDEAEIVRKNADYYVFHEHLEDCNEPVYFAQFVKRAAAAGLQYLDEAEPSSYLARLPPDIKSAVQAMSADLIQLEQYLDFLFNRSFRRTLLCRQEVALDRAPTVERIARFLVSSRARPEPPPAGASVPEGAAHFLSFDGTSVATGNPLILAALTLLHEAAPQAIAFEDLLEAIRAWLGRNNQYAAASHDTGAAAGRPKLAMSLLQLYMASVVGFHTHLPRFTLHPGERPHAPRLARLQSQAGLPVASLRHGNCDLNPFDRAMAALLDGTRARPALLDIMTAKIVSGELTAEQRGQPVRAAAEARRLVEMSLEDSLERLARLALLVDED